MHVTVKLKSNSYWCNLRDILLLTITTLFMRHITINSLSTTIYLIFTIYLSAVESIDYGGWMIETDVLPLPSYGMAIGYSKANDTIWLVGGSAIGYKYNKQVSFKNKKFTDHPILPQATIFGKGQFYTQINNILWMIDRFGSSLNTFNVDTMSFHNFSTIPDAVGSKSCLASISNNYLAVTGGHQSGTLSTVQMLNITDLKWINVPDMQQARKEHACVEHKGTLYAIGGVFGTTYLKSVEILNVSDLFNIQKYQWQLFFEPLTTPLKGHRVVIYENHIVILGGLVSSSELNPEILAIDTMTNTIVSAGSVGNTPLIWSAAIVVYPFMYLFGGWSNTREDKCQYHILPTMAPTFNPTISPSIAPSAATPIPTTSPTHLPTRPPTFTEKYVYVRKHGCDYGYCTSYSTDYNDMCQSNSMNENQLDFCCPQRRRNLLQASTLDPTLEPTLEPTFEPTFEPTLEPTTTLNPTSDPTLFPSKTPSQNPTVNPTPEPTLYSAIPTISP
eukprot:76954_1